MVTQRGLFTLKALVAFATALGLVVAVGWYGWLKPSFLSYPDGPFVPAYEATEAGRAVIVRATRCNSSSEVESYFVSARLYRLDQPPEGQRPIILASGGMVDIDSGCTTEDSAASIIPVVTPPGLYMIGGRARVDAGWRSIYVPWSTRQFRVVAPPPAAASGP